MNIPIRYASEIPQPDIGFGYIFVDRADNKLKIKKNSSIIEYTNTLDDIQLLSTGMQLEGADVEIANSTLTAESNYNYYLTTQITTLDLTIPAGIKNTMIQFTTGNSITFSCNIDSSYKINNPFSLDPLKTYVIVIHKNIILWTTLSQI